MIRMGMIGCGNMARSYLRQMKPLEDRLKFTALVDTDIERARTASEVMPEARLATDYREVLEDVDALIVALPHHLHHRVGLDLLEADKHVLLEKPMANTEPQCLDLIEAADRGKGTLMIGYVMRYHPLWRKMGELIHEKTFGECFHVSIWTEQHTERYEQWITRANLIGGGQLFSHGCHYIDLILHWMGRPTEGTHLGTNFGTPWMEREGTSDVTMKFESGATAYHFGTWGARGTKLGYAVHAHFTDGMVELDHRAGTMRFHRHEAGGDLPALAGLGKDLKEEDGAKVIFTAPEAGAKNTYNEVSYFLDCIEQGREPESNARQALQGLRCIWRLYQAEEQRRVADLRGTGLDEFTPGPDPVLAQGQPLPFWD